MEFFPDGLLAVTLLEAREPLACSLFRLLKSVFPKLVHVFKITRTASVECLMPFAIKVMRRDGRYYIHHRIRPPPLSALLPSHSIHN